MKKPIKYPADFKHQIGSIQKFEGHLPAVSLLFSFSTISVFCLKPISGIGGEKLVDGNRSTCLTLEQPEDVARIQTGLSVNQTCRNGLKINAIVRVNEATQCHELLSIIVAEKPAPGCSKLRKCQEIGSLTEDGNRVCKMRCDCADSANQCVLHMINEISTTNVDICEIDVI